MLQNSYVIAVLSQVHTLNLYFIFLRFISGTHEQKFTTEALAHSDNGTFAIESPSTKHAKDAKYSLYEEFDPKNLTVEQYQKWIKGG